MAWEKMKQSWMHTSNIMATLAEINRDKKHRRKPYSWKEFHPIYAPKRKDPSNRASIADVLASFGLKQEEDHGG